MTVKSVERVLGTPAPPGTRTRRSVVKPRQWKRYEPLAIGTTSVLVVLALWQYVSDSGMVPKLFLPSPVVVGNAFVKMFQSPDIGIDIGTSGQEIIIGYGLAIVVGLILGLLMGWYLRVQYALDPFVNFFYSTPRVALVPLFIIAMGIGQESKIAVIFLGALFPIIINTVAGVRNTDAALLRIAKSFGASDALTFRRIVLPGSVPFILTGFRLGVGHALTGLIVAELLGAQHGIGERIATAGQMFLMPEMFAGIILVAGTGMLLTTTLQRIENRFQSWRPQIRR